MGTDGASCLEQLLRGFMGTASVLILAVWVLSLVAGFEFNGTWGLLGLGVLYLITRRRPSSATIGSR